MNNPYFETYGDCEKAWDEAIAARDKEWMEWLKTFIYNEYGTIMIQDNCFQERMKEIGYEL
jgi:hypothetical protein